MSNSKEILKELINIDSQFNKSNKEIIDYLKNFLNKFECTVYKVDNSDLDLYNLVVKIKGESSENPLVFVGHTDTVLSNENWSTNPFEAIEKEGKIYGLGSSDMKAGLAAMISAVLKLDKKPSQDVYLVFDCDEEYEGKGGLDLVTKFSLENAHIMILEPTSRKITLGQKGCIDLEIETSGESLHSSLASIEKNEKYNANHKMIKICNDLLKYESKISKKEEGEYLSPILSLSYLSGGTGAANTVPDKCILRVSRRLIPSEDLEEVYKEMEEIILNVDSNAKIKKLFWGAPFSTDKEEKFVTHVKKIADKYFSGIDFNVTQGWTEASLFSKWGETIIFGPGRGEMAHQADEYVYVKDLEKFEKLCFDLL